MKRIKTQRSQRTQRGILGFRDLVGCCVFVVMLSGCASTPSTSSDSQLASVAWMAGSWANEQGGTYSEERWTEPRGGMMLGLSRTIVDGKTVSFEYLRIESTPEGIVYFASPNGQDPATPFRMTNSQPSEKAGEGRAVFSNEQHDFPQSIIYEREGNLLHAYVAGLQNGRLRREQWTWRRVGD